MGTSAKRKDDEGKTTTPERSSSKKTKNSSSGSGVGLIGKPVPADESRKRWPERYRSKGSVKKGVSLPKTESSKRGSEEERDVLQARCHYTQAVVDGCVYNLYDDAYVKAEDGRPDFIAKIVELFETIDKEPYFTAQWFYRAEDTVIKEQAELVEFDKKRVFYSDVRDDNPLNCIVAKVKIVKVEPNINLAAKKRKISSCDLYYDMKYSVQYSTFLNRINDEGNSRRDSDASSTILSEVDSIGAMGHISCANGESSLIRIYKKSEMTLLDLYSGCGTMSTGLCFGACLAGVNLVTRWAVDYNTYACESLKLNHPETEVRNESAEDFLSLLKEWAKLCKFFSVIGSHQSQGSVEDENEEDDNSTIPRGEFEVGKLLAICYGDPNGVKKPGLYFKVRWKGFGPDEDTWEPMEGLSKCKDRLKEFVAKGYRSNILPLPGDVDFICGGPPCQGVSGFNRFRNNIAPLEDPKNHQLKVFMDIVEYLRPKYVLMENVVDILRFANGFLGRYALGRLVAMNYQARLGIMAAGSYGLPQFRLRVFLWGAHTVEKLPQFPLPTHEIIARGGVPSEFEDIYVAYDTKEHKKLEKPLFLGDAISDLPPVTNDECEDESPYGTTALTEFQQCIRLRKQDLVGFTTAAVQNTSSEPKLYDHHPLQLNKDDFDRVCHIPKAKGANFRNLPGVLVNSAKSVEWDQSIERVMLPSGKPLVPDYAMSFKHGRSTKPFGRLWWDETVATVVTRAEPHNQIILHPTQDRVLSVRENARLQGFPDCYKLCGPVKEKYIQVGNAVAIPVALALGYTFGMACQGYSDDKPLTALPFKFPNCVARQVLSQQLKLDD